MTKIQHAALVAATRAEKVAQKAAERAHKAAQRAEMVVHQVKSPLGSHIPRSLVTWCLVWSCWQLLYNTLPLCIGTLATKVILFGCLSLSVVVVAMTSFIRWLMGQDELLWRMDNCEGGRISQQVQRALLMVQPLNDSLMNCKRQLLQKVPSLDVPKTVPKPLWPIVIRYNQSDMAEMFALYDELRTNKTTRVVLRAWVTNEWVEALLSLLLPRRLYSSTKVRIVMHWLLDLIFPIVFLLHGVLQIVPWLGLSRMFSRRFLENDVGLWLLHYAWVITYSTLRRVSHTTIAVLNWCMSVATANAVAKIIKTLEPLAHPFKYISPIFERHIMAVYIRLVYVRAMVIIPIQAILTPCITISKAVINRTTKLMAIVSTTKPTTVPARSAATPGLLSTIMRPLNAIGRAAPVVVTNVTNKIMEVEATTALENEELDNAASNDNAGLRKRGLAQGTCKVESNDD